MADKLTAAQRSVNMSRIRSRHTKPEIEVRRLVYSLGHRFRLHRKDLPGVPDLVFSKQKKVLFVHGCFWHQHTKADCLDGRLPKSNTTYWHSKLKRNVERDVKNEKMLREAGWKVKVIWECSLRDRLKLEAALQQFLSH